MKRLLIFTLFSLLSCTSLYFKPNFNSNYIEFNNEKDKVVIRQYLSLKESHNFKFLEPLFLKDKKNNIKAAFLLNPQIKEKNIIKSFISIGYHVNIKTYIKLLEEEEFYIVNSNNKIVKTIKNSKREKDTIETLFLDFNSLKEKLQEFLKLNYLKL